MTLSKRSVFLLLVILSIVLAIVYFNRPKPIQVAVALVETGDVEETVSNTRAGTIKACRRAHLSPSAAGQIAQLNVREGDQVKKGDLLLEIWNRDLEAKIALGDAKARAAVATAKASCLQSEVAARNADRLRKLQRTGAASEEVIDKAVTEAKASKAECESAGTNAVVAAAETEVIRAQLEQTRLLAPFDGVIAEVHGELNEYATPSPPGIPTPPAVDLINNHCFYVTAPIDEVDAPRVILDQKARISLDAYGDKVFTGHVRRIADYVLDLEKQARTVEVEVAFDDKSVNRLLAGYSADVEIIQRVEQNTLRIPSNALINEDQVYVLLTDHGILEQRTVEIGLSNWDWTQITSGLEEGDLIVTSVDREGVEDGALAEREPEE